MSAIFEFEAIGTKWSIDVLEDISDAASFVLLNKIKERVHIFDVAYSRFRKDSLVTKMSQKAGEFILPSDADLMISLYKKMYDATEGKVTPLIGQVLVDAGYDAEYSLTPKHLSLPLKWDNAMKWENPILTIHYPSLLDFGAGGKGYLVDIVSEIIEEEGIRSYCVDAGGDMRYRNMDNVPLKVGLENPFDMSEIIGVADVSSESICGSAGNRRVWANFHHIINPDTLSSPSEIISVWAVTKTTLVADLVTTGLFFSTPEKISEHFDFEYLIIYSDHTIKKSDGFHAEIFTA